MRWKAISILLMSTVIILTLSMHSHAQSRHNAFALKLGVFSPTGDLDDAQFDSAIAGEVAWGLYHSEKLSSEFGIGVYRTDFSTSVFLPGIGTVTDDEEITIIPVFYTLRGHIPFGRAELYGGLGVDLIFALFDGDLGAPVDLSFSSNDYSVFGGHVLAGIHFDITDRFFLGLEGKYLMTSNAEFSDTDSGIFLEAHWDLDGFTVFGQLGYRF